MSKFFLNLSLQALSIEDDRIHITFHAMNKEVLKMMKNFKIPLFQWKHLETMLTKLI